MKRLSKLLIFTVTAFSSSLSMAGEITSDLKEKIAEALIDISKTEKILLKKNEILELDIDGIEIDVDIDMIKELEERGLIDENTVTRDGAQCDGWVG